MASTHKEEQLHLLKFQLCFLLQRRLESVELCLLVEEGLSVALVVAAADGCDVPDDAVGLGVLAADEDDELSVVLVETALSVEQFAVLEHAEPFVAELVEFDVDTLDDISEALLDSFRLEPAMDSVGVEEAVPEGSSSFADFDF